MTRSHADEIEKRTWTTTPQIAPRKTIDLESLSFSSYVRLCTLISVCLGIVVGVLFFLADVLGMNTTFHWGFFSFADTESGVVGLFVGPFVFGVTGFVGSLFSYRLFQWALREFRGLPLTGRWKEVGRPEETKTAHPPT